MKSDELVKVVSNLSPAEQAAVEKFIAFLKEHVAGNGESDFLKAVDEFAAAHPELLRRLAQ
jgi:hypothetical protein